MQLNDFGSENILKAIFDAHRIIEDVEKQRGRILVHCEKGISRSASLVASHLMIKKGMDEVQAIEFLQKLRPQVDPNLSFVVQLSFFCN